MAWQAECWRDVDRMRTDLREELGRARVRRFPFPVRAVAWAGLGALAAALGEPLAAVPAVVLFEAFLVPRLAPPLPPTLGPLHPWRPPDSYRESPEAPASWPSRSR